MSSVPTRNAGNVQAPAKTCFAARSLARTSRRGDAKRAFTFDSVRSLRSARTQIKKKSMFNRKRTGYILERGSPLCFRYVRLRMRATALCATERPGRHSVQVPTVMLRRSTSFNPLTSLRPVQG